MNVLELDVLRAVGWALLHFVWQGAVLALLVYLAMSAMSSASAASRYIFATTVFLSAPLILVATIIRSVRGTASAFTAVPAHGFPEIDRILPVTALVWLAGVVVFTTRLALTWHATMRIGRISGSADSLVTPEMKAAFSKAKSRMGSALNARLRCVAAGTTPAVIGWMQAVVFVPMSVATGLSPDQVELLIAHELAHVRRHDYLVNLVQSWVEALLFFHPAIHWISRRVRIERELACDEAVVEAYGRPEDYGETLARLALLGDAAPSLAVGASSTPLQRRIRKLFGIAEHDDVLVPGWMSSLAIVLLLAGLLAGGQVLSAQSSVESMLNSGSGDSMIRVTGRHEHRNSIWSRSVLVTMASADGRAINELRLGRPLRGVRYRALIGKQRGSDSIESLRAEVISWKGRRMIDLSVDGPGVNANAEVKSLTSTFVRESGVDAENRARMLAAAAGAAGVIREVASIGDPAVRASYLRSSLPALPDANDRQRIIETSLSIRNSPVDVSRVLLAGLKEARSLGDVIRIVDVAPRIDGEAELVEILLAAIRTADSDSPALRTAVERAILRIPSEEARGVVARAVKSKTK